MGKGYLVDTNTIIDYLENKLPQPALSFIDQILIQFSIISRIEILVWNKATPEQLQLLNDFVNSSIIFGLDENIVLKTIEIRRDYRLKLPDAIIAATAMVYDLELITRNIKDFGKINELTSIDPYSI